MGLASKRHWESLERWRGTAFLLGGTIFLVDTGLLAYHLTAGTEPAAFGQGLVGASWTAAFVGLLGVYPALADRSRWLARIGAAFAVVGVVTMAAMAATAFGYAAGVLGGDMSAVATLFLPTVFLGIVLGFGSFGVATLRTDAFATRIGVLFLVLPATFLFNVGTAIGGFNPLVKVFGVVAVLTLSMLAIGYLLRTGSAVLEPEDVEATGDLSTG